MSLLWIVADGQQILGGQPDPVGFGAHHPPFGFNDVEFGRGIFGGHHCQRDLAQPAFVVVAQKLLAQSIFTLEIAIDRALSAAGFRGYLCDRRRMKSSLQKDSLGGGQHQIPRLRLEFLACQRLPHRHPACSFARLLTRHRLPGVSRPIRSISTDDRRRRHGRRPHHTVAPAGLRTAAWIRASAISRPGAISEALCARKSHATSWPPAVATKAPPSWYGSPVR
ncbi:Uncharacterised protein [Mycobacteroides abscessus subsp. abscessus]|nr:Uncharacterised protein [Mycobacteroides abscessus subsp. abscessus]